ncbi:hypothetical protein NKI59_34285 [Mesorhizobium sp. M0598]|uniref:hypothetical protein n=1 Tax=Mesorhizobium sp. M0598 TaxID=2956968 RepID=UPI00333CF43D
MARGATSRAADFGNPDVVIAKIVEDWVRNSLAISTAAVGLRFVQFAAKMLPPEWHGEAL